MSESIVLGLRLLSFCVAAAALGGGALRISARLTARADLRVLAAAAIVGVTAIGETLLLGLVGIGENGPALVVAAIAFWLVVRWIVAAPAGPRFGEQLAESLRGCRGVDAVGTAAISVGVVVVLAALLWHPYSPYDALQYHLAQPVIWLTNGHPGSLHVVNVQTPLQAYPKNTEVLLGWMLGLSHSYLVGTLLIVAMLPLSLLAMVSALRRLGLDARLATLLSLSLLTTPVAVLQLAGASTDLATLCWIAVTAALCFGALEEPVLLSIAFLAAGLAIGTKASAAVPVVVGIGVTAYLLRRRLRSGGRPLATGLVLGGGLAALWYVQDWVVYGAPLYPFSAFPSGPKLPPAITGFNTSFLSDPVTSLRIGTFHGFLAWFGGGPFLVAAALLAVLLIPVVRARDRRALVVCWAAAIAALLVWAAGPFTGYPRVPGTTWFPLNGTRYLLPSMLVVVLPIAIVGRDRGVRRLLVSGFLVAVIVVNIVELRHWPVPIRPAAPIVLAGVVLGAAVGLRAAILGRRMDGEAPRLLRSRLSAPLRIAVSLVAVTAVLGVVADGYVGREIRQAQRPADDPFSVPTVIGWLDRQSDWVSGHQPVAAGPILDALLAGPRLSHRLVLIPQTESCASVQRLHETDWIVVADSYVVRSGPYRFVTYTRADCLTGPPSFSGGGYRIYRPA